MRRPRIEGFGPRRAWGKPGALISVDAEVRLGPEMRRGVAELDGGEIELSEWNYDAQGDLAMRASTVSSVTGRVRSRR